MGKKHLLSISTESQYGYIQDLVFKKMGVDIGCILASMILHKKGFLNFLVRLSCNSPLSINCFFDRSSKDHLATRSGMLRVCFGDPFGAKYSTPDRIAGEEWDPKDLADFIKVQKDKRRNKYGSQDTLGGDIPRWE